MLQITQKKPLYILSVMTRVSHPMFYSQFVIFSGVRAQKTYIFDFYSPKKKFPREKFIRFLGVFVSKLHFATRVTSITMRANAK